MTTTEGKTMGTGTMVEIRKAYNSESGCRDLMDDVACCAGEVLEISGADALLWINAKGEVWVPLVRLKPLR